MSNIEIPWEIEGVMTPEESVSSMIPVIETRGIQHSGTFWTWEGKVSWVCQTRQHGDTDMLCNRFIRGRTEMVLLKSMLRSG